MGKSKTKRATATAPRENKLSQNKPNQPQQLASASKDNDVVLHEHLPPFPLVVTVLVCSGMAWMFSFRDVFATGKNIAGASDAAMLAFTKSTKFFSDKHGWKSSQGGFSAIMASTTDLNDMGGFFVRKLGGAASLAVHTQKLMPLLFHPENAKWNMGHFKPTLWLSFFSNLAICGFYASYMADFAVAGADGQPKLLMAALMIESFVMLGYLMKNRGNVRGPAIKMIDGKNPNSLPSRIVGRTVTIISSVIGLIAARDFFMPGQIIPLFPRDDIYLEWTGAFFHSPPDATVESEQFGMTADLYVGEKFLGQFLGLHLLLVTAFKFLSAVGIRYGSDGSGLIKAGLIWKPQAICGGLMLFIFRVFSPAALSASLDFRWHLMCIAYEAFILFLYAFF